MELKSSSQRGKGKIGSTCSTRLENHTKCVTMQPQGYAYYVKAQAPVADGVKLKILSQDVEIQ